MKFLTAALILVLLASCGNSNSTDLPGPPDLSDVESAVKTLVEENYAKMVADPSVANRESYARIAQAHGIDEAALAIWESLIAEEGSNFEREYLAGRIYFRTDPERARRHFEAARKFNPSYDALNICLAEICENAGDLDQAESLYDAALAADRSGTATFGLGRIAFNRGEFEKALTFLDRTRRLAPEHRPLLNLYVQTLFRLGREEESRKISEAMQAVEEEGATRPLLIADPIMSQLYRQRVSYLGLIQLGEAAAASQNWSDAADYYEKAHRARPADKPLVTTLAECLRKAGRLDEAKKLFLESLTETPDDDAALYSLALTEFQLENIPEGIRILEDLKVRKPDDLEVRLMLAIAIWKTDRQGAVNNLRYLLIKDPNNLRARLLFARIHFESGRRDEGKAELERILAIDPQNEAARQLATQFLGE